MKRIESLYVHTVEIHNFNAPREVIPLVLEILKPNSVVDIGCGTGTWLKVLEENGIEDYVGVDGDHLNVDLLKIPINKYVAKDLTKPFFLGRNFDLVISLEVAEHLDEKFSDVFVKTLVDHGEKILFSAAIPNQGGQNHLNEQWPQYWAEKFAKHGYYFHDILRPVIWWNRKIEWWYRQNIFLVDKNPMGSSSMAIVHPELYKDSVRKLENVLSGNLGWRKMLPIFLRSISVSISRRIG